MKMNPSAWAAQKRSWQILNSLNPVPIDLDRIHCIRGRSRESLSRPDELILERFHSLDFAIGVDVIPTPSMSRYKVLNPRSEFCCLNTQSTEFNALIDQLGKIDLVFIDSLHEEAQCRAEFDAVCNSANIVAFHDICNSNCPGIAQVRSQVKSTGDYVCFEYTDQYPGLGPCMGIGLAVRNERMTS